MLYTVACADLRQMAPADRDVALGELISRSTAPRHSPVLEARIRTFERRYEMTSEQLLIELDEGCLKETADISRWLFWLRALDR